MQAKGYKMKSASLEEILAKSEVREAKLIGYDETPYSPTGESGGLDLLEDSDRISDLKVYHIKSNLPSRTMELPLHCNSPEICHTRPTRSSICRNGSPLTTNPSNGTSIGSNGKGTCEVSDSSIFKFYHILLLKLILSGAPPNVSEKSRLYELCTANCWKPPVFECCQEMGPSHLKE